MQEWNRQMLELSILAQTEPLQAPTVPPISYIIPILAAVLGALVSGLLSFTLGRRSAKTELGQRNVLLQDGLNERERKISELTQSLAVLSADLGRVAPFEGRYLRVAENLRASAVISEFSQPVLLVGPRNVGKTSLLRQWYSPWNIEPISSTEEHYVAAVPVYDIENFKSEPHFADPDIITSVDAHLKLRVHDFPGEFGFQELIKEKATRETRDLRELSRTNLGIVVVCMFDAEDVLNGISDATRRYYNGDLFANLVSSRTGQRIFIERLIFVFNKIDRVETRSSESNEVGLVRQCEAAVRQLVEPIRSAVNPDRYCSLATVLSDENKYSIRGSSQVLGEAAVGLVAALAGPQAAADFYSAKASASAVRKPPPGQAR